MEATVENMPIYNHEFIIHKYLEFSFPLSYSAKVSWHLNSMLYFYKICTKTKLFHFLHTTQIYNKEA